MAGDRGTHLGYLAARSLAELGSGPYRTGEIAADLGRTVGQASPTRQQLLTKGLIYATEEYGFIDFTVPRFDEFMRRLMPIGTE